MHLLKMLFISTIATLILVRSFSTFYNSPRQNTNVRQLREIWLHSQYNLNGEYEFFGNMSDEDLRTYAALEYVQGKDPTEINFEDPPLAKYLFGISYLLSGNILLIQFILSFGVLLCTSIIARQIGLSQSLSLIPALVLAFDPLFIERSQTVNLDMPQLFFILTAILLLVLPKKTRRVLIALGIVVGAAIASKAIFVGVLLYLYSMFILWSRKAKGKAESMLLITLMSLGVYLTSYLVFFINHSIVDFLWLHVDIARLYRSYLPDYPWFEIWRILLIGEWRTWFTDPLIQPVKEYWVAWPLSTFLALPIFGYLTLKRQVNKEASTIFGWLMLYLLFQSTHVVFPRYILLALPLLYVLVAQTVMVIYKYQRG